MKKVLLSFAALGMIVSTAFSQRAESFKYKMGQKIMSIENSDAIERPVNGSSINPKIFQTLIWEDDFDLTDIIWTAQTNGQGDWLFGENTDPTIITDYTFYGAMASTSAANGFAYFDGIEFLVAEDVEAQDASIEMTNSIDLSAYESVMFTFEQRYMAFNSDATFVEVSLDNGATWEQSIDVNADVETNNDPALQDTIIERFEVNNSSEVKFRFRWENTSTDNEYGSGYAWMVDDVRIYELPQDDIELVQGLWGTNFIQVFQNTDPVPIDAITIPEQQISPIDFYADLYNLGSEEQTNIEYSIDVNGGSFTDSDVLPSLTSADSASVILSYEPTGVGAYEVSREISADVQDENPSNNQFQNVDFEVNSDFLYARDDGTDSRVFGLDEVADFYMYYEIFEAQQLAFVRVGIAPTSTEVSFSVVITDESDGTPVGSSDLVIIESSDLGTEMVIPVTDNNGDYLVMQPGIYTVKTETSESGLRLSGGGKINNTTAIIEIKSGDDAGAFGSFSFAPRLRLDFDPTVSINEEAINESNLVLYPNPASNSANLEYNLTNKSDVEINVVDITGKSVYSEKINSQNSGSQKLNLNTSDYNEGVYFVTLITNGTKTTKKLVIKK